MKRSMKLILLLTLAAALSLTACGLSPKQMEKIDGAMCNKAKTLGMEFTTTIVAGASKSGGVAVNGDNCSITTVGK